MWKGRPSDWCGQQRCETNTKSPCYLQVLFFIRDMEVISFACA